MRVIVRFKSLVWYRRTYRFDEDGVAAWTEVKERGRSNLYSGESCGAGGNWAVLVYVLCEGVGER